MSLIEQAAKRLEQLRQAGVNIPEESAPLAPLTNHVQATPKPEVADPPRPAEAPQKYRRRRSTRANLVNARS